MRFVFFCAVLVLTIAGSAALAIEEYRTTGSIAAGLMVWVLLSGVGWLIARRIAGSSD